MQADSVRVSHGSLSVDVPRRIFKGPECRIDPAEAEPFRRMIQNRYPWLSDNSVDVLMEKARKEMQRVRDEETNGREHGKNLASKGKLDEAIRHLERRLELEPDDPDSWYALGELLCKAGRTEEGYKAFNRGRSLFPSGKKK